ncbi:hypothetical protein HDU76_013284 [Blyttiomyces sp. JEL0837]|nr:hypothetical protein HDU76_013284 [Blyttiomyces sp. JEL0837]
MYTIPIESDSTIPTTSSVSLRQLNAVDRVPKIIHQSWKHSVVPKTFRNWPDTWRQKNPDWEYRLWTNEDNLRLITEKYPWFLDTFSSLKRDIMRADVSRYFYMYEHGGLYADLDMECLQPINLLLQKFPKASVLLGYMNHNTEFSDNVPNAFMISVPRHPVWLWVIRYVSLRSRDKVRPESVTGPVALKKGVQAFLMYGEAEAGRWSGGVGMKRNESGGGVMEVAGREGIVILDPEYIYPVDWSVWQFSFCGAGHKDFDEYKCKKAMNISWSPGSNNFAITYWAHSWGGK